jgi:hypothetical protein
MVPIEQKDWTKEDRASILGQNHPLDSTKRPKKFNPVILEQTRFCAVRFQAPGK